MPAKGTRGGSTSEARCGICRIQHRHRPARLPATTSAPLRTGAGHRPFSAPRRAA